MKNSCTITFEGLNVTSFLNSLCRQNIIIYTVKRSGRQCILQVDAIHSQKVVAQLKEKCYNIRDIRYNGVSFWLRFAKTRFVTLICIALCIAVVAVSSQFCLKIEVQGDFAPEAVREALTQAGVKIGAPLRNFDADAVENKVSNSVGAMYAVVNRRGSVVYVNVVALKQISAPIDMSRKRDLISSVNGVVTATVCEQGNLSVKVGDVVKKGDVLIEGRRIFNDGESRDVYALGRITVKQQVSGSVTFSGYKTEMQPTGNVYKNIGVVLFGKEYVNNCKYKDYTVETSYEFLRPLNLKIARNTYYETTKVNVSCGIEECIEDLKRQAYDQALQNCPFTPQEVEYAVQGDTVIATLYAITDIY